MDTSQIIMFYNVTFMSFYQTLFCLKLPMKSWIDLNISIYLDISSVSHYESFISTQEIEVCLKLTYKCTAMKYKTFKVNL